MSEVSHCYSSLEEPMLDRLELGGQSRIRRSEQFYAARGATFAGCFDARTERQFRVSCAFCTAVDACQVAIHQRAEG
jgi:hypothetical protein